MIRLLRATNQRPAAITGVATLKPAVPPGPERPGRQEGRPGGGAGGGARLSLGGNHRGPGVWGLSDPLSTGTEMPGPGPARAMARL